jgi:hypothetical protein
MRRWRRWQLLGSLAVATGLIALILNAVWLKVNDKNNNLLSFQNTSFVIREFGHLAGTDERDRRSALSELFQLDKSGAIVIPLALSEVQRNADDNDEIVATMACSAIIVAQYGELGITRLVKLLGSNRLSADGKKACIRAFDWSMKESNWADTRRQNIVVPLISLIDDASDAVRYEVYDLIESHRFDDINLAAALKTRMAIAEGAEKLSIASAILKSCDEPSAELELLLAATCREGSPERIHALNLLGNHAEHGKLIAAKVVGLFPADCKETKMAILSCLAHLGTSARDVRDKLTFLVEDQDRDVRKLAAYAIRRINND